MSAPFALKNLRLQYLMLIQAGKETVDVQQLIKMNRYQQT